MTRPVGLLSFLWSYFRRYWSELALAVVSVLIFSISSVLLLALFKPILEEALLADPTAFDCGPLTAKDPEAAEAEPSWIERQVARLNLKERLNNGYQNVKARLGIDQHSVIYFLPALFLLVFIARSLSDFLNGYLFQRIGLGATNDMRNDLYEHILHQSARFYSEHPSGELLSRVGNDISVMQNAVANRLLDLFQQSLTLFFLIWFLLSTNLKLALICLLVMPAIAFPFVQFGKGMRRTSARSQERLADLSNLIAEAVRGHRVVKAFGMENFELARFKQANLRHLKVKLKAQLLAHGSGPVIETLAAAGAAAFLIHAASIVRRGELKPADLVVFLTNLLMLYDPIRKLNKVNLILQESLAAGQRVKQVIETPNLIENRPGAVDHPPIRDSIAFEDVAFAYDDKKILLDIDLTIPRGQLVALVGPSGAGKSTLVNLLPRFFDPSSGRITIDGNDLRDISLQSLRAQIGIVTQETVLFNDTVRNNIAYGRTDLPLEQVRAAARAAFADEFINELPEGYETVIGESGFKLSGGQRQRLAIARALMKNPPILILDEATSHLDVEAEALVQKALHNLMSGRTALVIAHRLSTIQRADRILVLEAGRIVEEGRHDELLARPGVYRRLYDSQFQDREEPEATENP